MDWNREGGDRSGWNDIVFFPKDVQKDRILKTKKKKGKKKEYTTI